MHNKVIRNTSLALIFLAISSFAAGQEESSNFPLQVSFNYLADSSLPAIAIEGSKSFANEYETSEKMKWLQLTHLEYDYSISALIPLKRKYHPDIHASGNLGLALNSIISIQRDSVGYMDESSQPVYIYSYDFYSGKLVINPAEFEAAQDPETARGRFKNYNISFEIAQEIPYTGSFLVNLLAPHELAGALPLQLSFSGKRVYQLEPYDSSFYRLDMYLDWQLPFPWFVAPFNKAKAFETILHNIYIEPHWEVVWMKETKTRMYFEGQILRYFREGENFLKSISRDLEPVLFVKYVSGRRAPDFVLVNEWHAGIGATILF